VNQVLDTVAMVSLGAGALSASVIVVDILAGHHQKMWIMNAVWPITALYSGPLGLWFYYKVGRVSTMPTMQMHHSMDSNPAREKPMWQVAAVAATHCGAGCTLGDIIAECYLYAVPFTLFGMKLYGDWVVDYILAFSFGIAFQYFTITPMKNLSPREGLLAALKADALSLTAWQIGMYGWMAIAVFLIFGHELEQSSPVFWFMMQIAMLAGFVTSYPVNWWLLKVGIKEKM
jgi:Domain of unknown function (DUF4396)